MPPLTDEKTRGNVIRQWILGFPRDKIAQQNGVGAGTVSSIVANYKAGLEELDFDSIRQLAVEARQQGWNLSELASHARLYNYFLKSGASENAIESFIAKVSPSDIPHEKVIELVYQLHDISKKESIQLDKVPNYIKEKLEEKQKIDEQSKEADVILQSKNVNIEAINEHIQLNKRLTECGLSTKDIEKLANLIDNVKEYGFDDKKIIAKLRSIKRLEKKEERLRNNCEILSKQLTKYKEIIPLANIVWDLRIGKNELMSFKIAVNEAAQQFGLPLSSAAFHVLNNIRHYNGIGGLKKELNRLTTQILAVDKICFHQNKSMMAMLNLQSRGISEEQILHVNNFLEKNGYEIPNAPA